MCRWENIPFVSPEMQEVSGRAWLFTLLSRGQHAGNAAALVEINRRPRPEPYFEVLQQGLRFPFVQESPELHTFLQVCEAKRGQLPK